MDAALLEDALSGSTFTAEAYKLDIPTLDNRSARNLFLRFSGTGRLDATNADHAAILRGARLGEPVRMIVVGTVQSKTFALDRTGDELNYSFAVRVETVEAGDPA